LWPAKLQFFFTLGAVGFCIARTKQRADSKEKTIHSINIFGYKPTERSELAVETKQAF
jgi:hypothetical protein